MKIHYENIYQHFTDLVNTITKTKNLSFKTNINSSARAIEDFTLRIYLNCDVTSNNNNSSYKKKAHFMYVHMKR